MRFNDYLKERIVFVLINIGILMVTSALLKVLKVDDYAIIFIGILNFSGILVFYGYEYFNKKKYYDQVLRNLHNLDKKYLISEVMEEPSFLDGKILYEIIREANKSMNDQVAFFNINNKEYKEYIELWVHEIKTPIAACKLLVENNHSKITNSIDEELDRVEDYIEQALFYTRSNSLEKDYLIKEINIKQCINSIIKRNANILIQRGVKIQIENVDKLVYSDNKWVEFMVHQIISNSLKYMGKKDGVLKIYCEENKGEVILNIEDNGIGISKKSLSKVFEKGYTGENGRIFGKSTGMGLYLCKKLCRKLGLSIRIRSEVQVGTLVSILFPANTMIKLGESQNL
ncbi:sensor histidine kinase [Clostridium sp.]|uniref:sensor histidine kinase n=1 Tax=Clostridium sp. TaxID=1506 RepID=UPI0032168EB6